MSPLLCSPIRFAGQSEAAALLQAVRQSRIRQKSDGGRVRTRSASGRRVSPGADRAPADEAVDLAHDRPGAGFVEAKPTLYGEWNLHAIARMIRRIMRDRHHRHDRLPQRLLKSR